MTYCVKCEQPFDEVEWVKLKKVGFSGLECSKCVKKRIEKQNQQLLNFLK